jgi:hypothetical protein
MSDERMTAYLLQELTEEEAERYEEQCFAQDEWPAELESAEQELIDAYLNNELSKDRRSRFEKHYLTTDARKARVLTAHSFHKILPTPPPRQKRTMREKLQPFWRRPLPLAAGATLIVAVSLTLLVPYLMMGRRPPQTFQQLNLTISSSDRDTGVQPVKVTLPLRADALEIYLKLPAQSANAASYRVQWANTKDDLGELQIASKDTQSAVVVIPAYKVSPGDYALKLFTISEDGTEQRVNGNYYFTAEEP